MGASYKIVNPSKRQYFDIDAFGEYDKYPLRAWGNEDGHCIHALALSLLVSHPDSFNNYLFGAWSGDSIFYPTENHQADQQGFSFGVKTASAADPTRSLYLYSYDEYDDISFEIIDALCDWDDDILKRLIIRATPKTAPPYKLCKALSVILSRDHPTTLTASTFQHLYKDSWKSILSDITQSVAVFDEGLVKY